MEGFEGEEEEESELNWTPVQLLEEGGGVIKGWSSGDNMGSGILDQMQFITDFVQETKKEQLKCESRQKWTVRTRRRR